MLILVLTEKFTVQRPDCSMAKMNNSLSLEELEKKLFSNINFGVVKIKCERSWDGSIHDGN